MFQVEVLRFSDAQALAFALDELCAAGLTPRGLLFLALDGAGAVWLGVPRRPREALRLRVGEKLALPWPGPEGLFHFDAVHRLGAGQVVFSGDRRLLRPGGADDVAGAVSVMLRQAGMRSVFLSCTPHAPGTWVASRRGTEALHDAGYDGVVVVDDGVALARRFMDPHLHLIRFGEPRPPVEIVYDSPLGAVLFVERRAKDHRLVLSCQGGLVELDTTELPWLREVERLPTDGHIAVVGRLADADAPAWAVTRGRPVPWGLDDLEPVSILRVRDLSLATLGAALERHWI